MAIVIPNRTRCALCGDVLREGDRHLGTSAFISDPADAFWRYSDAAMHYECFQRWDLRGTFVGRYNDTAGRRVWGNGTRHHMIPDGTIISVMAAPAEDVQNGEPEAWASPPWNAQSTEDWNRPSWWHDYYRQLLAQNDTRRQANVIYRDVDLLTRVLGAVGELPRTSPQTLLDAGCGIALVPHVLAHWGFRVTAIDSCQTAIEIASQHRPSEQELGRCVQTWDPAKALQQLRAFQADGGSAKYLAGDWFNPALQSAQFGVVYCRNSLLYSTKQYWRQSLRRFYDLLSPGGVLLLENLNAMRIRDEVTALLTECGFVPLAAGTRREAACKYMVARWPTG